MTVSIANTQLSDTFNTWRLNTNLLATAISNNVITVAKTGRGGYTVGDGHVNGEFSSTTMVAATLKGGTWNKDDRLNITTNTHITADTVEINTANSLIFNGNVVFDLTGDETAYLGDLDRLRITGGSAGQFIRLVDRTSGSLEHKFLTLLDVRDMSSNSAHLVLSAANAAFKSFGETDNSPALMFTGGDGNDRIALYLEGGSAGESDLYLKLADDSGQSNLVIVDSSNSVVFTVNSDGDVKTNGTLEVVGKLTAQENATFNSDSVTFAGANVIFDDNSTMYIYGNVVMGNQITDTFTATSNTNLQGDVVIGSANADFTTINAEIKSNLVPNVTNTYDIGKHQKQWRNLFVQNANVASQLTVNGDTDLNNLTVTTLEANGAVDLNSTLNVDGSSTLNDLSVTTLTSNGSSTFKGTVDLQSDLNVDGSSTLNGLTVTTLGANGAVSFSSTLGVSGETTLASAIVSDLTNDRIVIAGASGALEDDINFTYNGTQLDVGQGKFTVASATGNIHTGGSLDVDGPSTITSLTTTTITANGAVDLNSTLNVDGSSTLNGLTVTTLGANGAVSFGSTLGVSGETTLASAIVSDLTNDRIVIAGTSGALEDDINFTYNGTQLSVGQGKFTVASATGNIHTDGSLDVDGSSTLNGLTVTTLGANGAVDLNSTLNVDGSSTLNGLTVTTLGANGAVDLNSTLNVDGSSTLNGLTVTTLSANSDVEVGGQLSVSENIRATGNVEVGGAFAVDGSSALNALTVTTLGANGAVDLNSTLNVDGSSTLNGLSVTTLTANGTVNLKGDVTLGDNTADTITMKGNFANQHTEGAATFGGTVAIGETARAGYDLTVNDSVYIGNDLYVFDDTTINGDLTVNGTFTVPSGQAISADDATFTNIDVTGNTVLGTSTTNELELNASITTNIIPKAGIRKNIGSTSSKWQNIYANNLYADDNAHVGVNLRVAGNTYITTNLDVGGDFTADGAWYNDSTVIFGNNGKLHANNTINNDSLLTAMLDDGAVTAAKVAHKTLGSNSISNDAVTANIIATSAVTAAKIASEAVETAKIDDGAVTAAKIANEGLQSNCYADNSIALGTKTTGNYVGSLKGTANEITVANTGTEGGTFTIGLPDDVSIAGQLNVGENVVIAGNLIVSGTTTTIDTTNMTVEDSLIALNSGAATNASDLGFIFNRGSTGSNAIFVWDESASRFILGTGAMGATRTGNLTVAKGILTANLDGTATTANKLQTTRNIGVKLTGDIAGYANANFDGSNDVRIDITTVSGAEAIGDYVRQVTANTSANGVAVYTNVSKSGNVVVTNTRPFDRIHFVDGDGTTVAVENNKFIKFVEAAGTGATIDINFTDITPGTAGDPYDLSFAVTNTDRGSSQNIFKNIAVTDTDSGYTWAETGTVVADTNNDTVTFVSGGGIDIDADATNDGIRITNTDRGSLQNIFKNISVTDTDSGYTWAETGTVVADTNDDTVTFVSGSDIDIDVDATNDAILIDHADITRTNNTSTASPANGGTFTAIDSITTNARGHVTAVNTKTVTLPTVAISDTLQSIAADSTNVDQYVTFVPNASGAQTGRSDPGLVYNPSTNKLTVGGDIQSNSDERLKSNIETITSALDKVNALRGVSFDKDGSRHIGLIAQEVLQVVPEVVGEASDEMKTLSVAYSNMVGLLVEAIKELSAEINELKANK